MIFMIFMIFMILIIKIIIFQKPLNPSLNPSTNPPYQPAWFPQILQSWGEPRGLTPWPPQADFPVATLGRCVTTFCASAACLRRCCSAASLRELSLGFFRSYTVPWQPWWPPGDGRLEVPKDINGYNLYNHLDGDVMRRYHLRYTGSDSHSENHLF